jgi:hypothetical protein
MQVAPFFLPYISDLFYVFRIKSGMHSNPITNIAVP